MSTQPDTDTTPATPVAQVAPGGPINARVLLRCFLRCYLVGAAFNTRGMQNVGLAHAVDPGLAAIHGQGPELRKARKRYVVHYNTHPFWTPLIVGVFLSVEKKIARGLFPVQTMENVRGTMVYTLSAIGDSFFGGSVLVCWSLAMACLLVLGMPGAAMGLAAGCFVGLQLFKAVTFWLGFREGLAVLQRLKHWGLIDWGRRVKMVNGALLAVLWYLVWPTRMGTLEWLVFASGMAALAAMVRKTSVGREVVVAVLLAGYIGAPWVEEFWTWLW